MWRTSTQDPSTAGREVGYATLTSEVERAMNAELTQQADLLPGTSPGRFGRLLAQIAPRGQGAS